MFAVVVTFQIDPAQWDTFMPLMHQNAVASLENEGGCHRFDVCTDAARTGEVFLYELYTNRAAFDVHLASTHFKAFDGAVAAMITAKDVRTFAQVNA